MQKDKIVPLYTAAILVFQLANCQDPFLQPLIGAVMVCEGDNMRDNVPEKRWAIRCVFLNHGTALALKHLKNRDLPYRRRSPVLRFAVTDRLAEMRHQIETVLVLTNLFPRSL